MKKEEEPKVAQLEHIPTNQSDSTAKHELELVKTLQHVDIENRFAYKGDDSDGKIEWTVRKLFASAFLAMLYTGMPPKPPILPNGKVEHLLTRWPGSQILLYFVGGSLTFIVKDLGTTVGTGWLPTANTLAIAAVAPFVGYLQDLFGKRYIALFGAMLLCLGCVVVGTAHHFGQAVAGMAIAGAGAGIGELTGLAG
jgi:MFS family permease